MASQVPIHDTVWTNLRNTIDVTATTDMENETTRKYTPPGRDVLKGLGFSGI